MFRRLGAARVVLHLRVPSLTHEILVELFRSRAELAPALLRLCAGIKRYTGTSLSRRFPPHYAPSWRHR